ncbi:MAG: hypothetical protein ACLFUV_03685 [Methanomassiliicoccales archaeon]
MTGEIRSIKKVSRAGEGGFSIYLPKGWIDGWGERQRSDRRLEMVSIGEQLILTPLFTHRSRSIHLDNAQKEEILYHILSSYINGVDDLSIHDDHLSEDLAGEMRGTIRFLDENLSISAGRKEVGYENKQGSTQDVFSLFPQLFDKVIESERLATELMGRFDGDIRKTVHLLRMMYAIEKEDVNRLSFQIFRGMAECRLPAKSFVEMNYRWAVANMLELIGDNLYGLVESFCQALGIDPDELRYPQEYLMERVSGEGLSPLAAHEGLRRQVAENLEISSAALEEAKDIILSKNGKAALEFEKRMRDHLDRMEGDLADSMENLHEGGILPALSMAMRVRDLILLTKGLTKRAALVYFE